MRNCTFKNFFCKMFFKISILSFLVPLNCWCLAGETHIYCVADKSDYSDGTDNVQLVFSEGGQFVLAVWKSNKSLGPRQPNILNFNLQNSKIAQVKRNNRYNPTEEVWTFITQDLGGGLRASLAFKSNDFLGRKLSPKESLLGQEAEGTETEMRMVGKLKSQFFNSNFSGGARWTNSLKCSLVQ